VKKETLGFVVQIALAVSVLCFAVAVALLVMRSMP